MKINSVLLILLLTILPLTKLYPGMLYAETKNKFTVGLILPLSGIAADYGISIQNSIALAIKDRPEQFSNINFIYDDVQYDTKQTVVSLNNLIDLRNIDLAITWGVPFCKALAPVAERRKIPLIGLCIDPETSKDRKYVIRFLNVTHEFMETQIAYLQNKNYKKLALLVADHSYASEMNKAFNASTPQDFTVTTIDGIPSTETDFRTHIIKLKQGHYDAVGVFLSVGQAPAFYKQASQLKFTYPTFGTNIMESYSEIKSARGSMSGTVFTNTKINSEYRNRYKKEFGNETQLAFGAPAYELAITIGELFNSLNEKMSAEQIMETLRSMPEKQGTASGPYRMLTSDDYGTYVQFPIVVKEIQGMSYQEVNSSK